MTFLEFLQQVHVLREGDIDYPDDTDVEWTLYLQLCKNSINVWNGEKGILWRELWTNLSDAATGDKTVLTADLDYDAPTDFRFPGSWVRTTDSSGAHTYWKVISPAKAQRYLNEGGLYCYFTGNKKTGFDLHFLQQPTVGHTINYPYYKDPTAPTVTGSVIEMSDPWFAVYHTLAALQRLDGAGDESNESREYANERLKAMRVANEMPPTDQEHTNTASYLDTQEETGFGV